MARGVKDIVARLEAIHRDIEALSAPGFAGAPVHGPPVPSQVYLIGQAPGPHEARFGRPFAWTAGKTLFSWFERSLGVSEEQFRARVYIGAVVRCFPGKNRAGGDRVPSDEEIALCRPFIQREVEVLRPRLVIPVGRLAIEQVLGHTEPIAEVVGRRVRAHFHGVQTDVVCLPHPSGASTWFKVEPGRTLLEKALAILAAQPVMRVTFPGTRGRGGARRVTEVTP